MNIECSLKKPNKLTEMLLGSCIYSEMKYANQIACYSSDPCWALAQCADLFLDLPCWNARSLRTAIVFLVVLSVTVHDR